MTQHGEGELLRAQGDSCRKRSLGLAARTRVPNPGGATKGCAPPVVGTTPRIGARAPPTTPPLAAPAGTSSANAAVSVKSATLILGSPLVPSLDPALSFGSSPYDLELVRSTIPQVDRPTCLPQWASRRHRSAFTCPDRRPFGGSGLQRRPRGRCGCWAFAAADT